MADDEGEIFSDINIDDDEEGSGEDDDDPYIGESSSSGVVIVTGSDRRYIPRMTRFAYSRLVETRAAQIEAGSPVGIDAIALGLINSLDIAEEELRQGKCPLYLGALSSDGKRMNLFHSNELQRTDPGEEPSPIEKIGGMSLEDLLGEQIVWKGITNPQKREEEPIKSSKKKSKSKTETPKAPVEPPIKKGQSRKTSIKRESPTS